jgi:hypothetical protein
MGKNSKRNCGNVCSICNHKDCDYHLYDVEKLKKMIEEFKRMAIVSFNDCEDVRNIKMIEAHLRKHGEVFRSWDNCCLNESFSAYYTDKKELADVLFTR